MAEFNGQLGVGVARPDGGTEFHPCDSDDEAWALYARIKTERPDTLAWVGVQRPGTPDGPEGPTP